MRARVRKWGNSLAVRIPKAFADAANLHEGCEVELTMVNGALRVSPVVDKEATLEELLSLVTDENRHPVVNWGPPVGREVW